MPYLNFAPALLLACSVCAPAIAQTAVDLLRVLAIDATGGVPRSTYVTDIRANLRASTGVATITIVEERLLPDRR